MNDWQFHTGTQSVSEFFEQCAEDELALGALTECAEVRVEDAGKAANPEPPSVEGILGELEEHLGPIAGWEQMTCAQVAAAAKALGI